MMVTGCAEGLHGRAPARIRRRVRLQTAALPGTHNQSYNPGGTPLTPAQTCWWDCVLLSQVRADPMMAIVFELEYHIQWSKKDSHKHQEVSRQFRLNLLQSNCALRCALLTAWCRRSEAQTTILPLAWTARLLSSPELSLDGSRQFVWCAVDLLPAPLAAHLIRVLGRIAACSAVLRAPLST